MSDLIYSFLDASLYNKVFVFLEVLFFSFLFAFSFTRKKKLLKVTFFLLAMFLLPVYLFFFRNYSVYLHVFYLVFSVPFTLLYYPLLYRSPKAKPIKKKIGDIWRIEMPALLKNVVIENIKRGLAIFGSAGSGKTESGYVPIIDHCAFHNFAGINLDYKDGELTEILNHFYSKYQDIPNYVDGVPRVKVKNLCLHRPEISDFINPLDANYLKSQDDLYLILSTLFAYNKKDANSYNFFENAPQSCLGGVIWRLKEDYPQYCSLPYAIGVCLRKQPLEIAAFIQNSVMGSVIGSAFLKSFSTTNEGEIYCGEQMTGIMGSLADILRQYASPNMFYIMRKNDFPLDINNPKYPVMLNVINTPKYDAVYSPFYSMCISMIINQMSVRGMSHSVLLLDEGATTKIPNFYKIPATRRSYDIATIYGIQDKVISDLTYSDKETKGILANLSYLIIGKANDPESVKYYKSLLEEIKEKTKTTSKGTSWGSSSTRISQGEKDTMKYKNQDISGLKAGQFITYFDGQSEKVMFDLMPFERIEPKPKRTISEYDIKRNYENILNTAESLN